MEFARHARRIAAQKTGLRPDQVERAVAEYRQAAEELHSEPEWTAIMHMSCAAFGLAQYGAEDTAVALQINTAKRNGHWESERLFTLDGHPYESYGEARAVELARTARPAPHEIKPE